MRFYHIFSLVSIISIAHAAVDDDILAKRACSLTPCKATGKKSCVGSVYSDGTCINLISSNGKPFVSGWTAPGCTCKIYSKLDCEGDESTINSSGDGKFAFDAISMEC